ncbi:hypothetical protein [Cupriavidus sp. UYPR2.512]|uniref:hypothetical protein n=1 Tax=Cupriavidus sp. UYPR2.512 TaxID=1080187 RepID=UPI00037E2C14|nr:hypothetical protein [Cupriavidus sp. UYPR2.512]UIF89241.1 hypothetical protein KAF44_30145 [Cupriavidus necator]
MKRSTSFKLCDKIRLAAATFVTAIAQLVPNWRWKIDGVATATVLTVLALNKTSIKATVVGPWMNVVAIFCLGLVLHRNLRAKDKGNRSFSGKPSRRGRPRG